MTNEIREHLNRIVYNHSWTNPIEWTKALDELADLSDEEIEAVAKNERN